MEKGVPIRAISRCILVLQAINRRGSLSMMEIAHHSQVPYPTACRIVQTLLYEGLIEREPARKRYRPTALVRSLAHGFQEHDALVTTARPHIVELTKKVAWPVSLATRVGQSMMVRDSTHALTSLTFNNYYPGFTLPILECASGKAYMAYAPADERASILQGIKVVPGDVDPLTLQLAESGLLFEDIRRDGYATKGRNRFTATPGKTSSIAVPILDGDQVLGSLALIFFSSAMKLQDAAKLYADDLNRTAAAVVEQLKQSGAQAAA